MDYQVKFRTKGLPGRFSPGSFSRDSIRGIIQNPFYVGMIARYPRPPLDMEDNPENPDRVKRPKREGNKREAIEYIPGQHEALYSVQLWKQNQQIRANKSPNIVSTRKKTSRYPLSGVAKCWECWQWDRKRASLRGSSSNGIPYYRCATMHDQYKKRNRKNAKITSKTLTSNGLEITSQGEQATLKNLHHTLRQDRLWPQVLDLLKNFSIPEDWYNRILAYYLCDEGMTEFEWQSYNLRRELERLRDLYLGGHLTSADFEAKAVQISRKIQSLQPISQPQTQEILPLLQDFDEIWEQLEITEQRALLKVLFEGLYFDGQGILRRALAHSPFDDLLDLKRDGLLPSPPSE